MPLPPELALAVVALVSGAAVLDVRSSRIPNGLVLLIAGLGVVARLIAGPPLQELGLALGGLVVGFGIWIAPFAMRWVGAGDVKLVAAVGAWVGPWAVFRVSLFAGLAGGLLALGYVMIRWLRFALGYSRIGWLRSAASMDLQLSGSWGGRQLATGAGDSGASTRGMPYAVAVLVGLLVELYLIR